MKKRHLLILILIAGAIILAPVTRADVPNLISYQGVLLDSEGDPVTTPINVTFTIYDSPSDGVTIWQETQLVEFDDSGRFDVSLGEIAPVTDDVFSDLVRWLGVQVEGDDELVPRTRIVSVAYAHRISTVDGATGGVISGDVTIQSSLSVNGDISVTGKATIGPGHTNTGAFAFVAGIENVGSGENAVVGGGIGNIASGEAAVVGGGIGNTASGLQSVVGGGYANEASYEANVIGGGWHNYTKMYHSTVGGGMQDTASGSYSTVSGGYINLASQWGSTVSGGEDNTASGLWSTVPGGVNNTASGLYSFAAGYRANAVTIGSFVWADGIGSPYTSTADNQFLIRASGGVGIGTDNPTAALHVEGEVKSVVSGVNFYMVPQGAIIMWSGSISSIPGGWALCNGANGTPNLSNRFIYGTTGTPGGTGGSETIPNHTHTVYHDHPNMITSNNSHQQTVWEAGGWGVARNPHTHTLDLPGITVNSSSAGSYSNLPPYYKLAFIMKM